MIIELFGPPGVGKTTFAKCLAERLRERGHAVELTMSVRPAEKALPLASEASKEGGRRRTAVLERLRRPLVEMLKLLRRPAAVPGEVNSASDLVRMLPPVSRLWSFRLGQYLRRLSGSWQGASASERLMIFDQAFVQAISSLMLLGENEDETLVSQLLDRCAESRSPHPARRAARHSRSALAHTAKRAGPRRAALRARSRSATSSSSQSSIDCRLFSRSAARR